MIDRQSRKSSSDSQKAIEEFLANGGKIQYCEFGARTEDITYTFGKKKKKKEENKK